MPNWEEFVREHLTLANLRVERRDRIVRELADQLEDFYRDARSRGSSEEQAAAWTRGQVGDWSLFH